MKKFICEFQDSLFDGKHCSLCGAQRETSGRMPIAYYRASTGKVELTNDFDAVAALFAVFTRMQSERRSRDTKRGLAARRQKMS